MLRWTTVGGVAKFGNGADLVGPTWRKFNSLAVFVGGLDAGGSIGDSAETIEERTIVENVVATFLEPTLWTTTLVAAVFAAPC